MPPRALPPRRPAVPEWTTLVLRASTDAAKSKAAAPAASRRSGPASLNEAVRRFVDRNWD